VIVYVIVIRKIFASVASFITFFFLDKCRYYDIGSNFIKLQTDTSCQL